MPGDWDRLVLLGLMVISVAVVFWLLLLGIHLTLPRGYVKRWHLYIWAQDEIDDIRAVKVPVKPGVRVSAGLWLAFAITYSYVIGTYVRFDTNHGALAGVVATLLFFYISAAMIFFAATVMKVHRPKWLERAWRPSRRGPTTPSTSSWRTPATPSSGSTRTRRPWRPSTPAPT